jgi:hypothetical protein
MSKTSLAISHSEDVNFVFCKALDVTFLVVTETKTLCSCPTAAEGWSGGSYQK